MIAFVLPSKDERHTISGMISRLREICEINGWPQTVIVVDDSSDGTAEIAARMGAVVVDGERVGLGHAMARGLSRALESDPQWIVTMDCDGQVDVDELPRFFAAAREHDADVVISSRFIAPSIDYPYAALNWLGNRILVMILRLATFRRFTDSHGGIRLMRPGAVRGLTLIGRHTYVQETLIQMHRRGAKIVEIPSRWRKRSHGESRVLASIFDYVRRTLPALLYWLRAHYAGFLLAGMLLSSSAPWPFAFGLFCAGASLWVAALPHRALRILDHRAL